MALPLSPKGHAIIWMNSLGRPIEGAPRHPPLITWLLADFQPLCSLHNSTPPQCKTEAAEESVSGNNWYLGPRNPKQAQYTIRGSIELLINTRQIGGQLGIIGFSKVWLRNRELQWMNFKMLPPQLCLWFRTQMLLDKVGLTQTSLNCPFVSFPFTPSHHQMPPNSL